MVRLLVEAAVLVVAVDIGWMHAERQDLLKKGRHMMQKFQTEIQLIPYLDSTATYEKQYPWILWSA